MDSHSFNVRCNVMRITSMQSYTYIRGRINNSCKDVYFISQIGMNNNLINEVKKMDVILTNMDGQGIIRYLRLNKLPKVTDYKKINSYSKIFESWQNEDKKYLDDFIQNKYLSGVLSDALNQVLFKFKENNNGCTITMMKNFFVKLLYWIDLFLENFLVNWKAKNIYKFVYCGSIKKQEYLFFYLLTLLGVDVLIISTNKIIDVDEKLLSLSEIIMLEQYEDCEIPEYNRNDILEKNAIDNSVKRDTSLISSDNVNNSNECKNRKDSNFSKIFNENKQENISERSIDKTEKSFEELALLASSVVMISIHQQDGSICGTGSGIMISQKGYILTNSHVVCGGKYYSVKIEEDDQIYYTYDIIKYNQLLDLALIRIDRNLEPIPIFSYNKKTVRGQNVVAIGSPLGLFNFVSNGIISGFRQINGIDMIQYTAPTSPGSSGGALLNMYGEVIGISTAGIDNGQNINLAVGHRDILDFIRGFY